MIQLLKQSKFPILVGIWGMAGNGKSTIAKALYDQIGPYFEDKYFIDMSKTGRKEKHVYGFIQNEHLFGIGIRSISLADIKFESKRVLKRWAST